MRWGHRRYQNEDGSLTPLGRIHYGVGEARKTTEKAYNAAKDTAQSAYSSARTAVTNAEIAATGGSRSYGTARASNLGENGSGVRKRSQINGRSSISYNSDMDTISDVLKLKGKEIVDNSSLLDSSIDSLRDREVEMLGRRFVEGYTNSYDTTTRAVPKTSLHFYKSGISPNGGWSPYAAYNKDSENYAQVRFQQDRGYEHSKVWDRDGREEAKKVLDYFDDDLYENVYKKGGTYNRKKLRR